MSEPEHRTEDSTYLIDDHLDAKRQAISIMQQSSRLSREHNSVQFGQQKRSALFTLANLPSIC